MKELDDVTMHAAHKRAVMKGIGIKPSHKGELHAELGVKQGKKIPQAKLEQAKKSKNPAERKRATFALNAEKWHH